MTNPSGKSFDPVSLDQAMTRRLLRRAVSGGKIQLPAVPGMIDVYVAMCEKIFASVGSKFNDEQVAHLRTVLEGQLAAAYKASQRSDIIISYNAPVGTMLNYQVDTHWLTIEGTYDNWIATRQPPYFGTEPDARIWNLSQEVADPSSHPVLDIGAGTGRNALALARRGHPVDVVEVTAKFAEIIRSKADEEGLTVKIMRRDVFSSTEGLRPDYQLILLSEVVPEFRTAAELRTLFELAANHLAPGGRLVFNTFVYRRDLELDDATRALAEQTYSNLFTWDELADSVAGLPLELVGDDSVYDYEKENLPDGAWPPTGWYAGWVAGQDVYDLPREECPNDMHWLVYQKAGFKRGADRIEAPAVPAVREQAAPAPAVERPAAPAKETPDPSAKPDADASRTKKHRRFNFGRDR